MADFIYFLFSLSAVFAFGAVLISLAGYFVPSIIAGLRGHENTVGIMCLNLLFGWTFIGWVVALIWSMGIARENGITPPSPKSDAQLVKCNHCDETIDRRVKSCYFCNKEQWPDEGSVKIQAITTAFTSMK